MLLRQGLHEPAQYNSILDAFGAGNTAPTRIADRAGVNPNSVGKYLKTLVSLGIVEKVAPFGEGTSSRSSRYRIKDPLFAYWYRFVSAYLGSIEEGVRPTSMWWRQTKPNARSSSGNAHGAPPSTKRRR